MACQDEALSPVIDCHLCPMAAGIGREQVNILGLGPTVPPCITVHSSIQPVVKHKEEDEDWKEQTGDLNHCQSGTPVNPTLPGVLQY